MNINQDIRDMWMDGKSYSQIAIELHVTRNVVAGHCNRMNLSRGEREKVERKRDQRDIDILCDLIDGHSQRDTAKRFGVSYTYVRKLWLAREESGPSKPQQAA